MSENRDDKQILIFRVGPVVCCVDSNLVDSIVHPQPLHHFPRQADYILGVLQYQNSAVSVVNLFKKFELPEPEPSAESRYVMGYTAKGTAGFWVDEVLEVTDEYDIYSSKPPEFLDQGIFSSTILWRDKFILKTDFTRLFMMSDAGSLKKWIENDAGNAISANYPNSRIEESDITAWTASVNEESNEKIQALMSRGVEFSQMIGFDTDSALETRSEDEEDISPKLFDEEAITVSPLTDLSVFSVPDIPEKEILKEESELDNIEAYSEEEIHPVVEVSTTVDIGSESDIIDLDELYAQSDISFIEEEAPSELTNHESFVISEPDIPASIIESNGKEDTQQSIKKSTFVESIVETHATGSVDLTSGNLDVQESSIHRSEEKESSVIEKTDIETQTEVPNILEDEEIIEALAYQHDDSKNPQKSDLNIDLEKIESTDIKLDEPSVISDKLSKSSQAKITESEIDDSNNEEIAVELPRESANDSHISEILNNELEVPFGHSVDESLDISPQTPNELSTRISEQQEVPDFPSSEIVQEIEQDNNNSQILAEDTGSQVLLDGTTTSISDTREESIEVVESIEDLSSPITEKSDEKSQGDSTLPENLTENIEPPVSDEEPINQGEISTVIAGEKSSIQNLEDNKHSIILESSIESRISGIARSESKIDTGGTSDDSDEEKSTASALAAQYGDIERSDSSNKISPQNQIKQSQPDVFEQNNSDMSQSSKNHSDTSDDVSSKTVLHPGFVAQSKADELTLSFIHQDLSDTKNDADLGPLTNLYTEFLTEIDEHDSADLMLKRSTIDSDSGSTAKQALVKENLESSEVRQLSDISQTLESNDSHISLASEQFSTLNDSNTNIATSKTGNFDDTVVVDDEARKFKDDVKTFFEENIKDKVEFYNQDKNPVKKPEVDLSQDLASHDDFLDSIDDKLDEDKELHITQDKAVGKIIERIERNREGKDNTSPARVAASILICAIGVFAVQHYWLNPTKEEIAVPSLELLAESSFNASIITDDSIKHPSQVHEDSNKEPVEVASENKPALQVRYTETPTSAIGGLASENAISNENLESVFNWKKHIIMRGDTLWALSERYLNDPFRYPDLARWNNIKNPDKIYPGNEVSYNTSEEAKKL